MEGNWPPADRAHQSGDTPWTPPDQQRPTVPLPRDAAVSGGQHGDGEQAGAPAGHGWGQTDADTETWPSAPSITPPAPGGQTWAQPGGAAGGWQSAPPPETAPTEPLAIWALVSAIVTVLIPVIPAIVAFVLAAQAAARIRAAGGALAGQGLVTGARVAAAVGLVVNAILVALLVWIGMSLQDRQPAPLEATGTTVPVETTVPGAAGETGTTAPGAPEAAASTDGQTTTALLLEVGDCFLSPDTSQQVSTVEVVDCDTPHGGEVAANIELADGPYPGSEAVSLTSETECDRAFLDYIGVPYLDSELGLLRLNPTDESWAAGDRIITCVITPYPSDGPPLVGSMRDANR